MTDAATRPIVHVKHLTMAFGSRTIMNDLSFEIDRGEIFFVCGNSGCGKSTLFKHIVGLVTPAKGRIEVDGMEVVGARGDDRRAILRRIGISYQGNALFGSLSVLENVCLPLAEFTTLTPAQRRAVGMSKLALVGLVDAAHRLPSEISGGMAKRAAVARALALDPSLVILDEPSAGLDPISSNDLDRLIETLRNLVGATFMIVSHELGSIFSIADRILLLDANRKTQVAIGPPLELRDHSPDPWVRRFLNGGKD